MANNSILEVKFRPQFTINDTFLNPFTHIITMSNDRKIAKVGGVCKRPKRPASKVLEKHMGKSGQDALGSLGLVTRSVEEQITIPEGEPVDLGKGVSGTVKMLWKSDPKDILSIGSGRLLSPENEGLGVTGDSLSVCPGDKTIPASRLFIEFEGEQYEVVLVDPPKK